MTSLMGLDGEQMIIFEGDYDWNVTICLSPRFDFDSSEEQIYGADIRTDCNY